MTALLADFRPLFHEITKRQIAELDLLTEALSIALEGDRILYLTPGFEGESLPWCVYSEFAGDVESDGNVEVDWTGNVDVDLTRYVDALLDLLDRLGLAAKVGGAEIAAKTA